MSGSLREEEERRLALQSTLEINESEKKTNERITWVRVHP